MRPLRANSLSEPYLVSPWQLENLRALMHALLSKTFVRRVRLFSHIRCSGSRSVLQEMGDEFSTFDFRMEFAFADELHVREVAFANGVVISSDRGLDIYRAPSPNSE